MSKKANEIEFTEILICRTIEENPNGTFSLIEVYPKDIAVAKTPLILPLSIWLNFESKLTESTEIEVKLSGKVVLEDAISVNVEMRAAGVSKKKIATPVVINNLSVPINKIGKLEISYKFAQERWKKIRTINIETVQ